MGLTVHYRFAARGSKTEVVRKFEGLRSRFLDLPVTSVGEVIDIPRASLEVGYARYMDERFDQNALGFMMMLTSFEPSAPERVLAKMVHRIGGTANVDSLSLRERRRYDRLRRVAGDIGRRRTQKILCSGNGLTLKVDVGEGCEWFVVMLGRFGKGRLWRGSRFTKTQYADHFVPCHLAVVRMLDLCNEAGILKSVRDEGRFYETRDIEELARNINASTDMIRAAAAGFRKLMEQRGFELDAPIEQSANYLKVDGGEGQPPGGLRR